jgi:arabinose-5-phosphate isomerase
MPLVASTTVLAYVEVMHPAEAPERFAHAARSALRTIEIETRALETLGAAFAQPVVRDAFEAAARLIAAASGRVVVTGMGKSGLVARKIAATLASTGTPAFFIHPAEASHGDLGMITVDDVVLALSWSGETSELRDIVTFCRRFSVPLIAMTSRGDSTLAQCGDLCLVLPAVQEACPNDLAPTSSTTVQAALGDALAVALIERRDFSSEDFRTFHPRGRLGAQLVTVGDLMSSGDAVPRVGCHATILEATLEMSRKRFGITAVVDDEQMLLGAFSDGDLRRSVATGGVEAPVAGFMSQKPCRVAPEMLAAEALALMNARAISQLFVCSGERLGGIVHLHDILRAGIG